VVGADPAGQPFSVTVPFGLSRAVRAVTCRPDVAERWAVALDWFGPGFSRTVVRGCRAAVALLTWRPVRAERLGMVFFFRGERMFAGADLATGTGAQEAPDQACGLTI
jgi:hypothetical protein